MLSHYEAIRRNLLAETTDGLADHAKAIAGEAAGLQRELDPARAGIEADRADDCKSLLPDLHRAATRLASVKSMEEALDAFDQLSQPMVRLRGMATGDSSVVVYCSMVKKAWLQPEGEIGNPYGGKGMARCGEVVSGR